MNILKLVVVSIRMHYILSITDFSYQFIYLYRSINKEPRGTEQCEQQALIYGDMNSGL